MTQHRCWSCEGIIETTDTEAVTITLANLWTNPDGVLGADVPSQTFYGHAACAGQRLQGARFPLSAKELDDGGDGPPA